MSLGATTLADVFDPIERGTKVMIRFRACGFKLNFIPDGDLLCCATYWNGMCFQNFWSVLDTYRFVARRLSDHCWEALLPLHSTGVLLSGCWQYRPAF